MIRHLFYFLSLALLISCGNLSKNTIQQGDIKFNNGIVNGEDIYKTLRFGRTSWYSELTLIFDTLVTKVTEENPYFGWFSTYMQNKVKQCPSFYVVLYYSMDSSRISEREYLTRWSRLGMTEYLINSFSRNLKAHPDYLTKSMDLYKIRGFCSEKELSEIQIEFPGYHSTIVTN